MDGIINEITQYDAIYRSDGPGYVRFRKYFLKKSEKSLNAKWRLNTYLPLRILLLETTRNRAKHSLNDLWLLLHMSRSKNIDIQPIPQDDIQIIPWRQISTAISAPAPVSDLHFAPNSRNHFAFSTIDGSIHFGEVETLQLLVKTSLSIPGTAFFRFQWINEKLIAGIGFSNSIFALSSDSHISEIPLPSTPSDIVAYNTNVITSDRSGNILSFDLYEVNRINNESEQVFQKLQPSAITLSKAEVEVTKLYNAKKPITTLATCKGSNYVIAGTSDGDIYVVYFEPKAIKKRKMHLTELKPKQFIKLSLAQMTKDMKPSSIDSLSIIIRNNQHMMFVNTRSEQSGIFMSNDSMRHIELVKQYRVPSLRAKTPGAINLCNNQWLIVCGTDMGDLIVGEEQDDQNILTTHESSISAVEWLPNSRNFIAADVQGLISFWTKT